MTVENFTTYTESDAGNRFTVTSTRATFANWVAEDGATYLYIDKGAAYYDGSFSFNFTFTLTTGTVDLHQCIIWGVSEGIGNRLTWYNSGFKSLAMRAYGDISEKVQLVQVRGVGSDAYSTALAISLNTVYYATVFKDEGVGTYGTLYLYLYSNAARTSLVGSITFTLQTSLADYQYLYALNTWPIGNYVQNGYIENLEDTAVPQPTVTTQAVTAISGTTATGNGNVTGLGLPAATQHGHCWSTLTFPTIADSKTENGVPSATGTFTSALTGLTASTLYYVRAYITNATGTTYGNHALFWAAKGTVWPTDTLARVTGIIHRYDREQGIYQIEVSYGDITSVLASTYGAVRRSTAVKQAEQTASLAKRAPMSVRTLTATPAAQFTFPPQPAQLPAQQTTEQVKANITPYQAARLEAQRMYEEQSKKTPVWISEFGKEMERKIASGEIIPNVDTVAIWNRWVAETDRLLAGGYINLKPSVVFNEFGTGYKPGGNQLNPRQRYLYMETDILLKAGRLTPQEAYDRKDAIVNPGKYQ